MWADEFNGGALDQSTWDYRTDSKHWSTQLPANVSVHDGCLWLTLKKEKAGGKSYTVIPVTQEFDGNAAIEFRSCYPGTTTVTARSAGLPDAVITITTTDTAGAAGETEPAGFGDSSRWG